MVTHHFSHQWILPDGGVLQVVSHDPSLSHDPWPSLYICFSVFPMKKRRLNWLDHFKSIDFHDWNTTFKPFQAFLLGQVTHVISDFPTIEAERQVARAVDREDKADKADKARSPSWGNPCWRNMKLEVKKSIH